MQPTIDHVSPEDFQAIARLRYEYALGIDTRDWVLYRSIFTDRITMDFSDYSGQPGAEMSADEWVDSCKLLFMGLDSTQHVMSNPIVDVDGKSARLRMYMKAEHFLEVDGSQEGYAIGGYYDDRLVRTPWGWKISAVTLKLFWRRGNQDIMAAAAARGAALRAEATAT